MPTVPPVLSLAVLPALYSFFLPPLSGSSKLHFVTTLTVCCPLFFRV